eukprot:GHVQ01041638.1.p1 GENE.GHVQ01041638.1~~GHVQ01041638.1.p1  ORF type:complete len:282 (+),score=40.42 GHVQ01041638.1:520-1365(+)
MGVKLDTIETKQEDTIKKLAHAKQKQIAKLTKQITALEDEAQDLKLRSVLVQKGTAKAQLRMSELEAVVAVQEEELNLAQDSIAYIKMLQGEAMLILRCSQKLVEAAEISETGLSSKTLLNDALDFIDEMIEGLTDPVLEQLSAAAEEGFTECLEHIHDIGNTIKDDLKSEEETWVTESGVLKLYDPWPGFDVATLGDLNTVGDIIKQLSPFLTHGNDAKIDSVGLSMLKLLAVTIPEAVNMAGGVMENWLSTENDGLEETLLSWSSQSGQNDKKEPLCGL